ncbi:tyrosine-type recombinase/integrase [Devosia sp. 1635]|uniref:tyrosine-type recombinase/integrase n=1 Tax=Devosia sp. 1635 TaxID=2726066 RepID=UPI001567C3BA|nr:tyrosine-type recombinase/integrase [Devosia sp. 1635]
MALKSEGKVVSTINLPYIKSYTDRLGTRRHYFNRRGEPGTALPGLPGSREFMAAYQSCLDAAEANRPSKAVARGHKIIPGSVDDVALRYYASAEFRTLAPITQATYRNEIDKFRREKDKNGNPHGPKAMAMLDRRGVKALVAEKADMPGAANKRLRTIKLLVKVAIEEELRNDDPTTGVKPLRVGNGEGFLVWEETHIEQFERHWPIGSKPRLALALLLFTAQRRSDVVRMGRQHIRNGMISVRQQKTGAYLDIPIHADLAPILDAVTVDIPAFLLSEIGKPFQPTSFGNWFGDRCRDAGLPKGYNAHGLRKAACRRLAESGCTTKEIMAISGHKTIEEVERYTRSADQKKLAQKAIDRLPRSN